MSGIWVGDTDPASPALRRGLEGRSVDVKSGKPSTIRLHPRLAQERRDLYRISARSSPEDGPTPLGWHLQPHQEIRHLHICLFRDTRDPRSGIVARTSVKTMEARLEGRTDRKRQSRLGRPFRTDTALTALPLNCALSVETPAQGRGCIKPASASPDQVRGYGFNGGLRPC